MTTAGSPRPLRVLVVDDSAVNRRLAEALVRRLGHEVVCAENGVEAVEAATAGPFDVVLMDVHMPEMNGIEATKRIRGMDGGQPHIVALTATADDEGLRECLAAGMNETMIKPLTVDSVDELLYRVRAGAAG